MTALSCIENVEAALAPHLESGRLPGYVAAVSVAGERQVCAAGRTASGQDAGPMTADTLFRIASLSKLVAGVLTLSLELDGVIALDAEIGAWLPELAQPRVIA